MSISASGFVPGSGAGIVLEDLKNHFSRERIYAEVLGRKCKLEDNVVWAACTTPNPGCSEMY
jgi:3-oxoacyl-(acyl-carrier-protein) synthase